MNEFLTKENLSTIFVWLWVIIGPYLVEYMSQDQFVTIGVAIVGIIAAVYSSKNPNTIRQLGNEKQTLETEETVLNDEYECESDGC